MISRVGDGCGGTTAAGTYAARATHIDSPGAGAGGSYSKKKGRTQPHVATGPELRQRSPLREEPYPMITKILALIWALVARRRDHDDDQVDLVPAACDDCGYPMSYCCCVADDERCTGWSQKTVDRAGRIGGAGQRCPERAVAAGGSAGGNLPATSWQYCEDHYTEHLEHERDAYDFSDYYDYVEATR